MHSHSSLGLLAANYMSSSDEEEELEEKRKCEEDPRQAKKLKTNNTPVETLYSTIDNHSKKQINVARLPLPSSIGKMFRDQVDSHDDESDDHQGRIRTFKHEAGNWASFVYISYEPKDIFYDLVNSILKIYSTNNIILERVDELHLSLSKTVVIRHHWIETIAKELQKNFSIFYKFLIRLKSIDIYTNEDKTRTFIGIKANDGYKELKTAVDVVDQCFSEFKLPTFYNPPSFHISIAWCNGDYYDNMIKFVPQIQETCEVFVQKMGECRMMLVDTLKFKTGNKTYTIELKT